MDRAQFDRKLAALEPWSEDFGQGMEYRSADQLSWYDLSVNANSMPCRPETAIIVTAWAGQLKWMSAALESYRKTGAFVILAYDNPFYPWMQPLAHNLLRCLPNQRHYILANAVVTKHITYDADKRNGWFWSVRYAQGIVRQFPNIKHVYVTNGDCLLEKPECFPALVNLLGNHELMAGQQTDTTFHTATMLMRVDAFHRIFDDMADIMRVPILGSHSPEVMLAQTIQRLKIDTLKAPGQPLDKDGTIDMYCRYRQPSTWYNLVGFRNLFAEYETLGNEGREVAELRHYADNFEDWLYWSGEEKSSVCAYWQTGDRRHLLDWWNRWEDSDYNRLYWPLDFFGANPIYEPWAPR